MSCLHFWFSVEVIPGFYLNDHLFPEKNHTTKEYVFYLIAQALTMLQLLILIRKKKKKKASMTPFALEAPMTFFSPPGQKVFRTIDSSEILTPRW